MKMTSPRPFKIKGKDKDSWIDKGLLYECYVGGTTYYLSPSDFNRWSPIASIYWPGWLEVYNKGLIDIRHAPECYCGGSWDQQGEYCIECGEFQNGPMEPYKLRIRWKLKP